jgi:hypothetical protein
LVLSSPTNGAVKLRRMRGAPIRQLHFREARRCTAESEPSRIDRAERAPPLQTENDARVGRSPDAARKVFDRRRPARAAFAQIFHCAGTRPLYLVVFTVDTTDASPHNARILFWLGRDFPVRCGCASRRALTAGGKCRCSICLVSPFSASMRCVTCAATGCAPTRPARSATMAGARAAAICCGRCRHRWDQDFACDLVPSRPAHRCVPGLGSGKVPKLTGTAC